MANLDSEKSSCPKRSFSQWVESVLMIAFAIPFFVFGAVAILNGGALFGIWFVVIAGLVMVTAVCYVCRGQRLGGEILGEELVIRHYFASGDRRIPIRKILRVYRSIDATILETTDGDFRVDDCFFGDIKKREELFKSVENRIVKAG